MEQWMSEPLVFLSVPTYGEIVTEAFNSLHLAATKTRYYVHPDTTSLTQHTFNVVWTKCLNHRHLGVTHFAMHHSDIEAQQDWLDILMEEYDRVGADILSVVVP